MTNLNAAETALAVNALRFHADALAREARGRSLAGERYADVRKRMRENSRKEREIADRLAASIRSEVRLIHQHHAEEDEHILAHKLTAQMNETDDCGIGPA